MSEETDFSPDRVFLHLSDIHFRANRSGDVHDQDSDLRNELERDLRTIRTKKVQKIDGIIVSGDIAFAGKSDEFAIAKDWLEHIAELIDCPSDCIMVTPGNHDVDRSLITDGCDIERLHHEIRAPDSTPMRDAVVAGFLRDDAQATELFSTIAAYNDFARKYGCAVSGNAPYWERDFQLSCNHTLRIRGMTSTLVSGPLDSLATHKMVYGGAQRQLMRQDEVIRVVVGHHPPSWTMEGDDADKAFSDRSALQLFGHKHDQWLTPAGKGMRVIAGAVHPDRNDSHWDPRYSLIAVRADDAGRLHIRIYPRRWTQEESMFIGDVNSRSKDYREHIFDATA